MKMAIDCRELTRDKLVSLGLLLEEILELSPMDDLILLSDVPLNPKYLKRNYTNISWGKKNNGGLDSLKYHWWMKKTLESIHVDVLYQVNQYSPLKIRGTKIITQIPDLYTLSGTEASTLSYRIKQWIYLALTLRNSSLIQTISCFSKKQITERFKAKNIEINYCGIFRPNAMVTDEPPIISGKYFLVLGRMNHWKGTLRLLELFVKYFSDTEYKIVFAGIPENESIADAVEEHTKKYDNIIHLGYVSAQQRENLYNNAQLLLYASRYDGFGLPPLEAALRNVKCLMNDIEVLHEVTRNKGYYVDYYGDDQVVVDSVYATLADGMEKTSTLRAVAESYTMENYVKNIFDAANRLSI